MSVLFRIRARLLVCVAALAALGALAFAPAAGANNAGGTYLALGDSLAYGYHQAQFNNELKEKGYVEPATFNDGYVDDFGAALKLFNPKLQIINDGCPGETTDTMIKGSGVPGPNYCAGGPTGGPFPKVFLHHPYAGTQLADALAIRGKPQRQHDHARHRGKRRAAVPRAARVASRQRSRALQPKSGPSSGTSPRTSGSSWGSCARSHRKRRSCSSRSTTPIRRCCNRKAPETRRSKRSTAR